MLPSIVKPYLDHPMVQELPEGCLEVLDEDELNNVIRAEDDIIRGVREYYLSSAGDSGRLSPGQFSSSVLIARGFAFLDESHYKKDVKEIRDGVWKKTPTTAKRPAFNTNIKNSTIPRLEETGLVKFNSDYSSVEDCIPYPIGSKLFVQKQLLEVPRLYEEQINHFHIIKKVQDFPELTNVISSDAPKSMNFDRDYHALNEIDAIRPYAIKGREYTFSKHFMAGANSIDTWETVLDTTDQFRIGIKAIMDLQGDFGGFISHSELVQSTKLNSRAANRLIRAIDTIGISRRTHTLEMEDALSRPTAGTLLNMGYTELNNAQSALVLTRSVPDATTMLNMLNTKLTLNEDELIEEFGIISVQKVRNTLESIGVIKREDSYDGVMNLVPFKGNEKFLSDVLAVSARSRHILDSDDVIDDDLVTVFKDIPESKMKALTEQVTFDYFNNIEE